MTVAPSAATAVWNINELTTSIFSSLDKPSLAASACVCRVWAEIALDALWYEVDDLPRLLSVLCPFRRPERATDDKGRAIRIYKFRRRLEVQDWERFYRYAPRVRRMIYDYRSVKTRGKVTHRSVFVEISRSCPTPGILPYLRTLVWKARDPEMQMYSLQFMQFRLRELDVCARVPGGPLDFYLPHIAARTPELTRVTLRFPGSVRLLEGELCALIRQLSGLQKIILPLCAFTSRIVEELSQLHSLTDLSMAAPDEDCKGDNLDIASFCPTLQDDAFPSIRRMGFSADLSAATRFLESPFFPSHLVRLSIHVPAIVGTNILRSFFFATANRCPVLTELAVDFIICPDVILTVPAPPQDTRPNIHTFRPLFACKCITFFEFRWDYPLHLVDRDIEEFALAWPRLEHFILNAEAIIEVTPSSLSLGALTYFARHCPRLRELGLYVDGDAIPPAGEFPPFRALQTLFVGASNISAADPVALFLSRLCPPGCAVVAGLRWPDAYGLSLDGAGIFDDRRMKICESWVLWNEVVKVLPVVTRARMEERALIAAQRREVAVLRHADAAA